MDPHQNGQDGGDICLDVVRQVTTQAGVDPLSLPPLFEAIECDALQKLMESSGDITVHLTYYGYGEIRAGTVSITEPDNPTACRPS